MEPGARPRGTTVTVNDLFYNTPARMKFLKKGVSEGTFVADIVLHERCPTRKLHSAFCGTASSSS